MRLENFNFYCSNNFLLLHLNSDGLEDDNIQAWAMDFVWSSVGNFLLYAKFSLSGGIQHGVLNIRNTPTPHRSTPTIFLKTTS